MNVVLMLIPILMMLQGCAPTVDAAGGGYLIKGVIAVLIVLLLLLGRQYSRYRKRK